MNTLRKLLVVAVLAMIAGCVSVDDLGEYWARGTIDSALEGHWKKQGVEFQSQDQYMSFEKAGDHYLGYLTKTDMPSPVAKMLCKAKSITLGNHAFLMLVADAESLKKMTPADAGKPNEDANVSAAEKSVPGGLQRYTIKDDVLTFFYLNDAVLEKAIKSGSIAGRPREHEAPTIAKLDGNTVSFLIKVANDRKNWNRVERYTRVANLEDALKASRAYPATKDTPKNSLINVNQPDLKYFADGKKGVLLRHLQSSPEWKVFDERGEIICYKRQKSGDRWQVSRNGFELTDDFTPREQTRRLFRFAKTGGGVFVNEYNRDETIVVNPLAGDVNLKMKSSDQGIASYLAVGQPGLWFEVSEKSDKEPRTHTREALKWLEGFLRTMRGAEEEIERNGFASALMPKNGVRSGKPTMDIQDGFQGGIYDVYAWVNPGRDGRTCLKVYDVASGKRLSEETILANSNERIGWSKDTNQLFFYNANITVFEGDRGHRYEARFELWNRSDDGEETKMIEATRTICGWQR